MRVEEEGEERRIITGQKETSGDDGYVHYLDCSYSFTNVHIIYQSYQPL